MIIPLSVRLQRAIQLSAVMAVVVCYLLSGRAWYLKATASRPYTFKAMSDESLMDGTGNIMDVLSWPLFEFRDLGKSSAMFRGRLLSRFGPPLSSSEAADAAIDYVIEARDEAGHRWILTAYEGASGPAIGGDTRDRSIYPVAEALADLINAQTPADFDSRVYYSDGDSTIWYGCKNGSCYYEERLGNHLNSVTW